MKKYNIICLSNQLWDTTSPTNKHHVMYRMQKLGHKVLFVDPPINAGRVFLKQLKRGYWPLERLLKQTKKDESGLMVYTPINLIPFGWITSKLHIAHIKSLIRKYFDPNRKTILWVYHVQISYINNYLTSLKQEFLIYDCVDNYETFDTGNPLYGVSTKNFNFQEELLSKSADLVFAVTPALVEKLEKYSTNVKWVPNAADYALLNDAKKYKFKLPPDLKSIPRPRIGYVGALDEYKLDHKLIRKLAQDHPKYSFVLIGPLNLNSNEPSLKELGLDDLSNVFYLGEKPYSVRKNYMAGFDVEIVPFQLNEYTVNSFPVKFFEPLSAGIPVVVTNLPAFSPHKDVAYVAKNHDEFSELLKKALEEDSPQRMKERKDRAKLNSWDSKVDKMLEYISETDLY